MSLKCRCLFVLKGVYAHVKSPCELDSRQFKVCEGPNQIKPEDDWLTHQPVTRKVVQCSLPDCAKGPQDNADSILSQVEAGLMGFLYISDQRPIDLQ